MTVRRKTRGASESKTPSKPRLITNTEERKLRAFIVEMLGEPDADAGWSDDVFLSKIGELDRPYCPFDSFADAHPADGYSNLDGLPWSETRKEAIASGEAEPTAREWTQWRRATATARAKGAIPPVILKIVRISDINPRARTEAVAVFGVYVEGAFEDGTGLWGIYPDNQTAEKELSREGVLDQGPGGRNA